jgi:putative membrane protein insertion efficiency factor
MLKKLLIILIRFYQKFLSPDQGVLRIFGWKVCRFYPTCSQYTGEAIEKYGVGKGLLKGAARILHCHPFNAGGFDPVK